MTEPTAQEAIKKAERAKAILADPIVTETFETLEKQYFEAWRDTNPEDADGRESMWQLLWASAEFRRHLSLILQRGQFHKNHLDKVKKRQKS